MNYQDIFNGIPIRHVSELEDKGSVDVDRLKKVVSQIEKENLFFESDLERQRDRRELKRDRDEQRQRMMDLRMQQMAFNQDYKNRQLELRERQINESLHLRQIQLEKEMERRKERDQDSLNLRERQHTKNLTARRRKDERLADYKAKMADLSEKKQREQAAIQRKRIAEMERHHRELEAMRQQSIRLKQ